MLTLIKLKSSQLYLIKYQYRTLSEVTATHYYNYCCLIPHLFLLHCLHLQLLSLSSFFWSTWSLQMDWKNNRFLNVLTLNQVNDSTEINGTDIPLICLQWHAGHANIVEFFNALFSFPPSISREGATEDRVLNPAIS